MAGEGEEQGGKFEDLFDDLDKFFTPAERSDRDAGNKDDAPGAPPVPPTETDILPIGWQPDVELLDLSDAADPPNTGEGGHNPEGPEKPEGPSGEDEASRPHDEPAEQDWTRLRDVLAEEESGEEFEFLTGEEGSPGEGSILSLPADETDDAGGGGEWFEEETPHELTVEDMKKAPPEYRDLPGAGAGGGPEDEEEEPAAADEGGPESVEEVLWEDPGLSEVEAAADQLAEEFGAAPDAIASELLADLEKPVGPRTVKVGEPESMSGPTWEDPTSRVVTSERTRTSEGRRNLPAAVLTGVALAAAALIALAWKPAAFAVVAGVVVLIGQAELYGTMQRRGYQPATALGLVMGALILGGAYLKGEQAMAFLAALGLALTFLWYMAAAPKAREGALANIGATMLGMVYVPYLAGYILVILSQARSGRSLMLAILGLTFLYDVAAFGIGSLWGARPLAPTISPKKSWEGLLGATVLTFAVAIAALTVIDPLKSALKASEVALIVVVFAPLGDLAESVIKRDLGVKDMGSLLPGHGGALDRIDSVLFVAPATFYLLRLIL